MNEVLYPRNIFQKLGKKDQDYFLLSPLNVSLCCGYSHTKWGHSREWREYFYDRACDIYGRIAVEQYVRNAPLKLEMMK